MELRLISSWVEHRDRTIETTQNKAFLSDETHGNRKWRLFPYNTFALTSGWYRGGARVGCPQPPPPPRYLRVWITAPTLPLNWRSGYASVNATKFLLLSVLTLIDIVWPSIGERIKKSHFRLSYVVQKCIYLCSLMMQQSQSAIVVQIIFGNYSLKTPTEVAQS